MEKPVKPFKSYDSQIKILKQRGLIIKSPTNCKNILKRENYYNIINGYKDIFLEIQGINEKYYTGTKFEHILC